MASRAASQTCLPDNQHPSERQGQRPAAVGLAEQSRGWLQAPQMSQVMMQMSREMMKAGVIDEMMEDTLDSALDTEDTEEQTEAEVDKVGVQVLASRMSTCTCRLGMCVGERVDWGMRWRFA